MSASLLLVFVCGLTATTLTQIRSAGQFSTSVYQPLSKPVESSRIAVASYLISWTPALVGSQWPIYLRSIICMKIAANLSNLSKYWKS